MALDSRLKAGMLRIMTDDKDNHFGGTLPDRIWLEWGVHLQF